ncbi:MAG TPA: methyltransferase domain-containing protein [Acidimicrobiia bacterium]|nr:methyltransferase domain-containing protein [Acidimicrobiia bacterium]
MSWSELFEWWVSEVSEDPAYEEVVTPLLLQVLQPESGSRYLDVGCGEGRVMRTVEFRGASVVGLDLSYELVSRAGSGVVADMARMPMRDHSFPGVYSVLTLEHVADHETFFSEAARVTTPGGVLALVINHPTWTAPGSTPIADSEGEILWRPGKYFSGGSSEVPAGESTVTFHHRSLGELLNAAAAAGWSLEEMVEQPHHGFDEQAGIPRLLACRWRRP